MVLRMFSKMFQEFQVLCHVLLGQRLEMGFFKQVVRSREPKVMEKPSQIWFLAKQLQLFDRFGNVRYF